MVAVLLVGRLVLVAVFAVAGITKLIDREGSRQAIADFGLPASLATPLGILLPVAELAVAITLLPASTALWGAVGALGLLLLFIAGIGANLARGHQPDCHCFGQLHSAPAGWRTLARNGVLAALAGFLVWNGWNNDVALGSISWIWTLSTVQLLDLVGRLVVLGLLAGQWWFLLRLLRQNGRLLARLKTLEDVVALNIRGDATKSESLPVGTPAPTFALNGLRGEKLTLDSLLVYDRPVMLLFMNPNCSLCNVLLPKIGRWQDKHAGELTIAVVSRGDIEENRFKASEHGLANVLLQEDWEVAKTYRVSGAPSAVVILPDGTLGSLVVAGPKAIEKLVTEAANAASDRGTSRL
jgi:thiol-disulfide isomerase/thioredoxin